MRDLSKEEGSLEDYFPKEDGSFTGIINRGGMRKD
jgi:hypothetical protein